MTLSDYNVLANVCHPEAPEQDISQDQLKVFSIEFGPVELRLKSWPSNFKSKKDSCYRTEAI